MQNFNLKLGVPILYTYNYMYYVYIGKIELARILEIIWT